MAEEIYLLEENKGIVFNADQNQEWQETIKSLNLTGQISLLEKSGGKSPVPFPFMNEVMTRVYSTLCPREVEVAEFSTTPIPLMVLGVLKLCETEQYFGSIQVWSAEGRPDPILVGRIKTGSYSWDEYLLARWGDALDNFEQLKEQAKKLWLESSLTRLREGIKDNQDKIEKISILANKYFAGGSVYI